MEQADTDLRLCRFFGLSEGYFLGLQNAYDTLEAKRRIVAQVAKIKPYKAPKVRAGRQGIKEGSTNSLRPIISGH